MKAPLRIQSRVLDEKSLYACFLRNKRGAHLQAEFNAGLQGVDARKIISAYMRRVTTARR